MCQDSSVNFFKHFGKCNIFINNKLFYKIKIVINKKKLQLIARNE